MLNLISTKELARTLKVSIASVNYYTNLGLFSIEDRDGNKRLYDKDETLAVYRKIRRLRKQGYPLRLVQQKINSRSI